MSKKKTQVISNRAAAHGQWELAATHALQSAARRTRSHPGWKREKLEASIREFGILDPLTVSGENVIVDGHLRHEIALALGFRSLPVIRIEHLNDAELRAHAIAANKLPAVANYDLGALRIELEEIKAELPRLDLTQTGFTIGEIDRISGHHLAGLYDDLDQPDEPLPTAAATAKQGDIYAGTVRPNAPRVRSSDLGRGACPENASRPALSATSTRRLTSSASS